QPVCDYHIPLTSPISHIQTPVHKVACTDPRLMRGAANAPRPSGTSGLGFSAQPLPGASTGSGPVQLVGSDGGIIDPGNGVPPFQIGYTGGQSAVMGDQSWQAL